MELPTLYSLMKRRQRGYRTRLLWPVWSLDFLEFIPIPGLVVWGIIALLLRASLPDWNGNGSTVVALVGIGYIVATRAVFWWWPLSRPGDFLEWYFLNRQIEEDIATLTTEDCLESGMADYLQECAQLEAECVRIVRFYTLCLVGSSHALNLHRLEQFKLLHVRPFIREPARAANTPDIR